MSANISNGQFVNLYTGEARITAFAQNSSGLVSIFSLPFSVPNGGIQVNLDTILGRNKEIFDIFNKPGEFAGTTSGKEQLVEKTGSITLRDDFVYLSANNAEAIDRTKHLMRSIAMGDIFSSAAEDGVTFKPYKVVGTNGTTKTGKSATGNKAFGLLTQLDGRLIVPQSSIIDTDNIHVTTQSNTRVTAYNKSSILVMFELLTRFDENKAEGYRFVYTLNSNFSYQEQEEANEVSFDQMMLSDVRYINEFFYKGLSTGEYNTATINVPAKKVKVGTSLVRMFKAPVSTLVGIATIAAANVPTDYIDTDNTVKAYTVADGDVCVGYNDATKTYGLYVYDTTNKWELVTNNVTINQNNLTPTILNASGLYPTYDFDFEAEDFRAVV